MAYTIPSTSPATSITAGDPLMIEDTPAVAFDDGVSGEEIEVATAEVYDVAKVTGAISQGEKVYFDSNNNKVTTSTSGGSPAVTFKEYGTAWADALSGDATVPVKLKQ